MGEEKYKRGENRRMAISRVYTIQNLMDRKHVETQRINWGMGRMILGIFWLSGFLCTISPRSPSSSASEKTIHHCPQMCGYDPLFAHLVETLLSRVLGLLRNLRVVHSPNDVSMKLATMRKGRHTP